MAGRTCGTVQHRHHELLTGAKAMIQRTEIAKLAQALAAENGLTCKLVRTKRGHPRAVFTTPDGRTRFVVLAGTHRGTSSGGRSRINELQNIKHVIAELKG